MKTSSFIGSNKNAGKTTAMNFILKKLSDRNENLIITSIGINGEGTDQLIGSKKPYIRIYKNNLFVTAGEHLKNIQGLIRVLDIFAPPLFGKVFVLAEARGQFDVVLEGPNSKKEILLLKKALASKYVKHQLLIDGSIDRQFLGDPEISDKIYFSMLVNAKLEQQKKIQNFINALSIPPYEFDLEYKELDFKSLLLDDQGSIIYQSDTLSFSDDSLMENLLPDKEYILVLKSSLTDSLAAKLRPLKKLKIILENFTLYRAQKDYQLNLYLLKKGPAISFFYKQDAILPQLKIPSGIDIYREDLHEVRL